MLCAYFFVFEFLYFVFVLKFIQKGKKRWIRFIPFYRREIWLVNSRSMNCFFLCVASVSRRFRFWPFSKVVLYFFAVDLSSIHPLFTFSFFTNDLNPIRKHVVQAHLLLRKKKKIQISISYLIRTFKCSFNLMFYTDWWFFPLSYFFLDTLLHTTYFNVKYAWMRASVLVYARKRMC